MNATRTNALLVPLVPDPRQGQAMLGHVAARLTARLPRFFESISNVDLAIAASIGAAPFGEWSNPAARSYHIGSSGIFIISGDDRLTAIILEYRLGGQGSPQGQPNGKQGRAAAMLMKAIADFVSHVVADGWPGGGEAQFVAADDGMQHARADDRVATINLAVSALGTMIGQISIAFPVEWLARVSGPAASPRDSDWCGKLRESVLAARLSVRAVIARPELPAAVVVRLAVGDVLPISKPENVPLYSGGHVVGSGAVIEIAGRTAVQFKIMEPRND